MRGVAMRGAGSGTRPVVSLDIISDLACPWCYVGKGLLDRALVARPGNPFRIEWHPFQLNPDLPPEGTGRAAYLAAKFGGPDAVQRLHAPLVARAAEAGLPLDLDAIERTPNTLDAHRLVHWAGLEGIDGLQSEMVDRLMRAYWSEGRDIGDPATLARIAAEAGMDSAAVGRLLASDADRDAVKARADHARARGVSGVPSFILADSYVLQGAQPVALWLQVIDELEEQIAKDEE